MYCRRIRGAALSISSAFLAFFSVLFCSSTPAFTTALPPAGAAPNEAVIEIGDGWAFGRAGSGEFLPAEVPGSVHTDLAAAGLIENPFFGTNHLGLEWIEDEIWEYRVDFAIPPELAAKENLELVFDGLDTVAEVYLNGSRILKTDNMFRRWSAVCSSLIREGDNRLRVLFFPAAGSGASGTGLKLPGGERVHIRKAAYQFGWDWAPRILTCGIWRRVYLRGWDRGRISSARIIQRDISESSAHLTAEVEIVAGSRDSFEINVSGMGSGLQPAGIACTIDSGVTTASVDFRIENPRLWWAAGMGEQELYDIIIDLQSQGEVLDRDTVTAGLREIELVTAPDSAGSSFYFRLNGVPVFMKGANYVPQDIFPSRVGDESYRALIEAARDMNMNMLRVWGGGIYEKDIFYRLCDENGILVWQDFMFACGMYPSDDPFLANVAEEAKGVIRRLRNHCCVAIWCGNNESDEGWHNWGWQERFGYSHSDSALIWEGYEKLFHRILPSLVEMYDGSRDYISTSPKFGRGDRRSLTEGDFHNWFVWHDGEPFENYREKTGRFMSEFGFQSLPTHRTVESFVLDGEGGIYSEALLSHQKHPRGNELIREYMKRDYAVPSRLGDFIYISQLLQARGVRIGIESQRRAAPFCMGSLFWQLNDCWPGISFSCIDYFGRWKALAYSARDGFAGLLLSPVIAGGHARVYAVSGEGRPISGDLAVELVDFRGEVHYDINIKADAGPGSSTLFFSAPVDSVLGEAGRREAVLRCALFSGGREVASSLLYFVPPREMLLPDPGIQYSFSDCDGGYILTLRSENLAKNIYLEIEGEEAFFGDNYFDMLPGESRRVMINTDSTIDNMERKFRYRTLHSARIDQRKDQD